ncbi:hypothetical protein PICMEDRAFT_80861 [Pichia membranifaciens NRRL Y-2026]|uniref:Defective in cullin neddylation protein n=1 Tax=Pichia membranifaciens NRRL Y-2026 TaxID=763406 RepID=A0A1E3NQI8_9ASCO|nr:hypothetical protein PICMEDRAFT_80861 [Pichia membranifaciens NRRL Y-2026]ODQ48351.1 hypothetical protein PICMEDRAFT_80861 [Pichia membranifaciens NRRL Y-2026]
MSNTDQFMQITGCMNRDLARRYIRKSGGFLDLAIDNYYNHENPAASSGTSMKQIPQRQAVEELNKVFDRYAEHANPNQMDIDGTIAYFTDLGIDPEKDVEAIIAAYTLESPSTGVFTRDAFVKNWAKVNATNAEDMSRYLHQAKHNSKLMDLVNKFAFKYALEEGKRKLAVEDAVALWRVIYNDDFAKIQEPSTMSIFINDFVASGKSGKESISMDEWNMSRLFFSIPLPELEHLSEDAAWPVLMDDFVDFLYQRE